MTYCSIANAIEQKKYSCSIFWLSRVRGLLLCFSMVCPGCGAVRAGRGRLRLTAGLRASALPRFCPLAPPWP